MVAMHSRLGLTDNLGFSPELGVDQMSYIVTVETLGITPSLDSI